jgi:protein involved in sex pheromone biosynthesis
MYIIVYLQLKNMLLPVVQKWAALKTRRDKISYLRLKYTLEKFIYMFFNTLLINWKKARVLENEEFGLLKVQIPLKFYGRNVGEIGLSNHLIWGRCF